MVALPSPENERLWEQAIADLDYEAAKQYETVEISLPSVAEDEEKKGFTRIHRLGSALTAAARGISNNSRQLEATHPSNDYLDF